MLGKVLSFSIGMSSKNIVNACEGVGKNLSAYIKAGKKVDLKALSSIYQKFTPQNNSVKLTSNVEKLREFLLKNKSSAEQADAFCSSLQACVVKLPKDDLFFVPIDKLSPRELVNISTHEFEHYLYLNYSSPSKIMRKLGEIALKLLPQKIREDFLKKSMLINQKSFRLQRNIMSGVGVTSLNDIAPGISVSEKGLLKHFGADSMKKINFYLRRKVRENLTNNPNENLQILKFEKFLLKDEARAYKVGGKALRDFLDVSDANASQSEILSMYYDETIKALNAEIKNQNYLALRKLFGLPHNTKIKKSIPKYARPKNSLFAFEEFGWLQNLKNKKIINLKNAIEELKKIPNESQNI